METHTLTSVNVTCRKGHYTRALEEAIQTHAPQWPQAWLGRNPLHGGGSFNKMTPEERVCDTRVFTECLAADRLVVAHPPESAHYVDARVLRSRTSHHEGVLQATTAGR